MDYDIHDWNINGWPGEFVYGDNVYIDEYYFEERWKPINGFEDYWVSNLARIWSSKTRQFIKVKPMDDHGHLGVCLYRDGCRYYRYIHRLVAEAFIPNPYDFPVVRHIDDLPYYNTVEDLRWGTSYDNSMDAIRNGKAYSLTDDDREKSYEQSRTPILAIDLDTGRKITFKSQGEASRKLGIPQANIWKVLNRERRSARGYRFEYVDRGDINENN